MTKFYAYYQLPNTTLFFPGLQLEIKKFSNKHEQEQLNLASIDKR